MINFRRKLYIYPEIQNPVIKNFLITMVIVSVLQILCIYGSMYWLQSVTQSQLDIVVDRRVLGPWKNFLFLSILGPLVINAVISLFYILWSTNKFAGPIYRIEREITSYLKNEKTELNLNLRKDDSLKKLAQLITDLHKKK